MAPQGEKTFRNAGWTIRTVKGPIMGDKETDEYRRVLSAIVLPEMVFHVNRVELVHEASGTIICFNALDALAGWRKEDIPPLQVRVAEEWRKAREHEIELQKAVQLTYDWTFTTPYTCTVVPPGADSAAAAAASTTAAAADGAAAAATDLHHHPGGVPDFVYGPAASSAGSAAAAAAAAAPSSSMPPPSALPRPGASTAANGTASAGPGASSSGGGGGGGGDGDSAAAAAVADGPSGGGPSGGAGSTCAWQLTTDQIDRGLLMERDPILFYDEIPLYESDLDDNGVSAVTLKLRIMPKCWLVLLRTWVRVDGSLVRLRESRHFCRHDKPDKRLEVLQEVKYCEGAFSELRSLGAPDEGSAYMDADAASQVFQAVAPVGLKLLQMRKLVLPASAPAPAVGAQH